MHILFLSPRLPYPSNRGDKIRPWNFAKSLAKRHRLYLLSLIQSEEEQHYIGELRQIFDQVETVLLKPWQSYRNMLFNAFSAIPLQVYYFHSVEMQEKVDRFLQRNKVDIIYTFHLRMALYVTKYTNVYKVLDLTDSVSMFLQRQIVYAPFYLKPILSIEHVRAQRYEQKVIQWFNESWIISTIDRNSIWDYPYPDSVVIVPNGVDTVYFSPTLSKPHTKNIIFVGYMGSESIDAITYFCKEIFPLVKQHVPEVKFFIVGANPPQQVKKLGQDSNIIVTGFVEDLRPYYNNAAVAIAPMRFVAGMQNKILESMAMEVPVVTTTKGNEGIDAEEGEEIFVADSPAVFATKIIQLLNNWELCREMGKKAREFVKSTFTWDVVIHRMDEINHIITDRRRKERFNRPI